ncbi:MAG TPA: NADH-quinone oxidoreductase subunit NuoE [Candidatus Acetothermia bacterium]|nr:NADH-quinone oxidoreductase subunit NuoE [Candidatus Acetothermia bacterium]HEX32346.1 NADH-quinone oxidoreductase subunit NuoE [Candidatus Acetothermia bacterium]
MMGKNIVRPLVAMMLNEEVHVNEVLKKYPSATREDLLDILHDIQESDPHHFLSDEVLTDVASHLGMDLADIKGTASFYSMFSFSPRGKHVIRICDSPPCQLLGATTVLQKLIEVLGVAVGETTSDGLFTLETSSCLGMCGVAPAMMIDNETYGNLTPSRIVEIIERIRREDETS